MTKHTKRKKLAILLPIILIGSAIWAYYQPLPGLSAVSDIHNKSEETTEPAPNIGWSSYGEQAIGVVGYGVLASNNQESPLPTASIAKVMAALGVLDKYPLLLNQSGPDITINASDVSIYQQDLSQGESVAAVQQGEQISEYQALEAMLLPSANNFATTLTNWAFGSQANYLAWANSYAKTIGMDNSSFADASGFSPLTVSTPTDLVLLGETAIKNPVIAQIIDEGSAEIPIAGMVYNVDTDLGSSGIDGIKTGDTDQAGGCFLFSASYQSVNVVGVILGAPDLGTALHDAPEVLTSSESEIQVDQAVTAGQVIGHYSLPWGGKVSITSQNSLKAVALVGTQLALKLSANKLLPRNYSPKTIGNITFSLNNKLYSSPVKLAKQVPGPSFWWRLFR
ncbi:MAG TPA: hypothetical protein VMR18_02415 [Candidatus Saccharimonadales bacterium]|nr:hypothetical protein [Candidatus Saccharimonadales bacterium]